MRNVTRPWRSRTVFFVNLSPCALALMCTVRAPTATPALSAPPTATAPAVSTATPMRTRRRFGGDADIRPPFGCGQRLEAMDARGARSFPSGRARSGGVRGARVRSGGRLRHVGGGLLREQARDDLRHAVVAHGHPVERVGRLHRPPLVRD